MRVRKCCVIFLQVGHDTPNIGKFLQKRKSEWLMKTIVQSLC